MTNLKLSSWIPGQKTNEEKNVSLQITQSFYECSLLGLYKKQMTFKRNGVIGLGNTESEYLWDVKSSGNYMFLEILSKVGRTFILQLCDDEIWRGYSEIHDDLKIELTPLKPIYNGYVVATVLHPPKPLVFPKTIHAILSGQLGNCLRNICTIKILSDTVGADWDIDLSRGSSPKSVNYILSLLFPGKMAFHDPDLYTSFPEDKLLQFKRIYGTNSDPIVEAIIESVPSFEFGTCHIYAARPGFMSDEEYIRRKFEFYAQINWPIIILRSVQEFIDKIGGNLFDYIGLHIRHGDNFRDSLKCDLNLNTGLNTFFEKIDNLPYKRIFLCTDDLSLRKVFQNRYPQKEIIYPDSLPEPLYQPLYEMYLLSLTQYIIGSFSSTFSYEACFIKGTDLEIYYDNAWKYYSISKYKKDS